MPNLLSKPLELALETIIELYERLPAAVHGIGEPSIKGIKTFLYLISEVRLQVLIYECSVVDSGNRFRMLYVGKAGQARTILDLLGCHAPHSVQLKTVFPWNLKAYLDSNDLKHELTIIHVNKVLYKYLKMEGFLRIPKSVHTVLNLSGTMPETQALFSKTAVRKLKWFKSSGFSWEIRKDKAALLHFYHHMYKPYVINRFGEFAVVDSFNKVRRLFRTGYLVTISQDDRIVAAGICRVIRRVLLYELSGMEQGNRDLLDTGAGDALYCAMMELAFELNCTHFNYRGSKPFINDGVLRFKQFWGTRLIDNPKECGQIGVRMSLSGKYQYNPFFEKHPIYENHGKFSGLILLNQDRAVTVPEIKIMANTFIKPGLVELRIFSQSGFDEAVSEYLRKNDSRIRIADPGNIKQFFVQG